MLGRMYFRGDDRSQNVLVFVLVLNSLTLDNSKKVTGWIWTGVSTKNLKSFDTNLAPTMSNLAAGKLSLKLNNSVWVQKYSSSLYSNFILNLFIVYESNNAPRNPSNNFVPKNVYLVN